MIKRFLWMNDLNNLNRYKMFRAYKNACLSIMMQHFCLIDKLTNVGQCGPSVSLVCLAWSCREQGRASGWRQSHLATKCEIIYIYFNENQRHDHGVIKWAESELRVAFKCLSQCHCTDWMLLNVLISSPALTDESLLEVESMRCVTLLVWCWHLSLSSFFLPSFDNS